MAVLRKVYGGCMIPAQMRGIREASSGGGRKVCIIHGLNISHKELIYLLQKLLNVLPGAIPDKFDP